MMDWAEELVSKARRAGTRPQATAGIAINLPTLRKNGKLVVVILTREEILSSTDGELRSLIIEREKAL